MEAMEYAVGTMHGQGFARLFRTERFAPSAADHDAVKAAGREVVEKGFAVLDKALEGKNYIAGSEFSPADAALFYVEFWAAKRLEHEIAAKRFGAFRSHDGAPGGAAGPAARRTQLNL